MLLRNALSGSRCAFFPRKVFNFGGKTALPRKHTEASPLTRYSVKHKFQMPLKRQRSEGGKEW